MQRIVPSILIAAFTVAIATSPDAAAAQSLISELEYSSVNAGSESTSSAAYSIVSIIVTDGVSGERSSSIGGAYTMEPVVGSPTVPGAAVHDWTLY